MRFIRYAGGNTQHWGTVVDDTVYSLAEAPFGEPTYKDIATPGYRSKVQQAVDSDTLTGVPRTEVQELAPVPNPGKIICVGLNYHDHAEEQDEEIPDKPILFAKSSTSVTNPNAAIIHPDDIEQVDYEVELGIVMGRTSKNVPATDAMNYIAGYTVVNDVSARDAQFEDGQFFRGKSYDTFAPMGPELVTDDTIDPNALDVETRVNGETKQSSNTDEFIFDTYEIVAYLSRVMTLHPGDVISTGTPGGVGVFRDPPELLEPGDEVEVEIESIGTLRNHVIAE
ncbi:fumarylacetoacetate hydrolase family protein [Haladaptatus halobius]|uniref:fumarylacetoacetate hydrolase family protein n=1 Tax=Haladaptatus halobius TaxID=2884875 RepID=UPI001D0B83CD|nr:fumarylacetoacetate hydrolase family protein [Haladaptatus halobius]